MKGKRALVLALVCAAASAEAQTWSVMPGHGEEGLLVAAWGSGRENLAFLSQGGTILKSTDGGRSFTHLKLDAPNTTAIWGTGNELYVLGPGIIYHSTDSTTWTGAKILNAPALNGVWGSGPRDVYVVGDRGTILHSTDGGLGWTEPTSHTQAGLAGVWGAGTTDVFIVGAGGTILHSGDGGKTFAPQTSGVTSDLYAVWGTSKNDVWAVGADGTVLHTTGGSWGKAVALAGASSTILTAVGLVMMVSSSFAIGAPMAAIWACLGFAFWRWRGRLRCAEANGAIST